MTTEPRRMDVKTKIVRIAEGEEGVAIPAEMLMELDLIPGSEVEMTLDRKRRWILIRPLHGEDFLEHFRDTMDRMA